MRSKRLRTTQKRFSRRTKNKIIIGVTALMLFIGAYSSVAWYFTGGILSIIGVVIPAAWIALFMYANRDFYR